MMAVIGWWQPRFGGIGRVGFHVRALALSPSRGKDDLRDHVEPEHVLRVVES